MTDDSLAAATPLPFTDVTVDDPFWTPRLKTLRDVTMETVYESLEETGRIDNLRIAAGEADGEFSGRYYNDSDVYKWLEAACYLLAVDGDPTLRERVDDLADVIESAQEDDGYLNSYFQLVEPEAKWTNLHAMHELYCAGHFFEAAVAHHRATGDDQLLDVARRLADHVDEQFGPDAATGYPGHEEVELALVKLFRETGERRYLDLASYFVDERGREPSRFEREVTDPEGVTGRVYDRVLEGGEYDGSYFQDHAPVREQDTAEGHAVRATYLYCGMADVAMETGDRELVDALEKLWSNVTERRMYVTGGVGSSHEGERFTVDYDLPNETSYAETCAALGNVLWNHRMLQLTGEGRFGDVMERTLYNGLLAGLSLSGDRFFYANPLEVNGDEHALHDQDEHRFATERQPWFETACCPTNVPRLLLTLGQYAYLRDGNEALYVNLYVGSNAETAVDGTDVAVAQTTDYPWSGTVEVEVDPVEPVEFALKLRLPDWCDDYALSVDGTSTDATVEDDFVTLARTWTGSTTVELDLDLDVDRIAAHPDVRENAGRVALRRGPLVYCLEGADHDQPLSDYALAADPNVAESYEEDLLDGVVTLTADGVASDRSTWEGSLYRSFEATAPVETSVTAVPYYGWGHRDPGEMRVWVRSHRPEGGDRFADGI
ncbi:MAG: beta-L-arabinofuranosidase domain-containing protein [Haloarculaceae archaeon]